MSLAERMADDEAELKRFERALARKSGQAPQTTKKYGANAEPESAATKLPVPTQVVHRPGPVQPAETRGTPKLSRLPSAGESKLDQALDEVKNASRQAETPKKEEAKSEEKIDTLERKRRERAARRAAEAEALRLEQEKADASIERRKKEREERRKQREQAEARP